MNNQVTGSERSSVARRLRDERGIAALLVLYGLSVFSVLALTMVSDAELERTFRNEASTPDLHLVLFSGRADSETVVGRLNLPTILRESGKQDSGVEVHLPGADITGDFGPGSTYSVQLSSNVRVCCDTGDEACANVPADATLARGSVNQNIRTPKAIADNNLQFDLSTFPTPDNLTLDPAVATGDRFLVKAAKEQSVDPAAPLAGANLTCRIEKSGTTLASGILALQPTAGASLQKGPFTGKLQLKYGVAKTEALLSPALWWSCLPEASLRAAPNSLPRFFPVFLAHFAVAPPLLF